MRYRNVSQCAGGSSFSASWRISSCSSGSVVSGTQMFDCHHMDSHNSHTERQQLVACTGDRVSQLCWITHGGFVCPKRCSENHKDVIGFGQRKLPKANCAPLKDSLQPTKKKKNPLAILAHWSGFAQIIYRCNSGRAEGTGNFAISAFDCLHTTWKSLLQRSCKASMQSLFSTHSYLTPFHPGVAGVKCFRQPGCLGEMFQLSLLLCL